MGALLPRNRQLARYRAEPKPRLPHLNETLFTSLSQARVVLTSWQRDDNEVRPHSGLGGQTPASIRLPSGSPASRSLRAGFAGGLRPVSTQAAPDRVEQEGRDGETAFDRTEKHQHDETDRGQGLYF